MTLSFDMQGLSPSVHIAFTSPWGSIWVLLNTLLQFWTNFATKCIEKWSCLFYVPQSPASATQDYGEQQLL